MDETDLFFKLFPKRSYILLGEDKHHVLGTKDMKAKARVSLFVCTNATGTLKVPMYVIGKAPNPRCFRKGSQGMSYFSQANAWSDAKTFKKWFYAVFLPFVRNLTSEKVFLLMDNCGPHSADLNDSLEQVTILTFPPNFTSMFQPMEMVVIATLKMKYKSRLSARISLTIENRIELRSKAMHMNRGTKGLEEGYDSHMLDVCELLKEAWHSNSEKTVARCWIKADIFRHSVQSIFIIVNDKMKKTDKQMDEAGIAKILDLLSRIRLHDDDDAIPDAKIFNSSDVLQWVEIEDDAEVREAFVNGCLDTLEQETINAHAIAASADQQESQEKACSDCEDVPSHTEIAALFEEVESLVHRTGVRVDADAIRKPKRALSEAHNTQQRKKRRQTLISEHFSLTAL
ncbi:Jerky protein-like [Gracilariopsis chorda]|uniref:Jerky protein-like n=1 Tax=Gracilariopsis chorda TaxID=448386 RepID=A0A2V3ITP3_9FLOR|nr:Jerky protein-like [Gracilariopsis chorda]|eukprot:PXF45097.1 Jerky protein-like [Gracilariopsis chorda]